MDFKWKTLGDFKSFIGFLSHLTPKLPKNRISNTSEMPNNTENNTFWETFGCYLSLRVIELLGQVAHLAMFRTESTLSNWVAYKKKVCTFIFPFNRIILKQFLSILMRFRSTKASLRVRFGLGETMHKGLNVTRNFVTQRFIWLFSFISRLFRVLWMMNEWRKTLDNEKC